jgi:hypothetical protein
MHRSPNARDGVGFSRYSGSTPTIPVLVLPVDTVEIDDGRATLQADRIAVHRSGLPTGHPLAVGPEPGMVLRTLELRFVIPPLELDRLVRAAEAESVQVVMVADENDGVVRIDEHAVVIRHREGDLPTSRARSAGDEPDGQSLRLGSIGAQCHQHADRERRCTAVQKLPPLQTASMSLADRHGRAGSRVGVH